MKKIVCYLLSSFLLLQFSFAAKLPVANNSVPQQSGDAFVSQQMKQLTVLSAKELGTALGRKLTLKEKIEWFFFKKQMRNAGDVTSKQANNWALLGFIFSIAGLVLFQLFAIPGLILSMKALRAEKEQPGILTGSNKGLAMAGKIISIIDFVLLFVAIIIIVAILSAGFK